MSFADDKFSDILPRRTGVATGGANERQMLRGSSESFRTVIRTHADGSTTKLRTRNGMPEFETIKPEDTSEDIATLYMETGQAEWQFPGSENPTRNKPATWRLLDLDPQGRWMGAVNITSDNTFGSQVFKQPTPIDEPSPGKLRDSIPSVAIGYPPPKDALKQAIAEEERGPYVIMKKIVCAYFPPAIFSGKMRLFMQAQYGAPIKRNGFDYQANISGSSATLTYNSVDDEELPSMQFGFWSHFTTGLYSATDYQYYIIQLQEASSSTVMNVLVTPLKPSRVGKAVRRRLLAGKVASNELDKAEAYLLSSMSIETDKTTLVGSFDPGLCGHDSGEALAFGWKFNRDGSKASIVRLGSAGSSLTNNLDGRAKEVHLTIHRSAVFDGSESGKWTVTGSSGSTHNWLDGWGYYNIFAPENETSTALLHFSYTRGWNAVAPYSYSDVPIYGYYNADDVWTTVNLSRNVYTGPHYGEQKMAGGMNILPSALDSETYDPTGPGYMQWKNYTKRYLQNVGWVEDRVVTKKESMAVQVGAWSYSGERTLGTFSYFEAGPGGSWPQNEAPEGYAGPWTEFSSGSPSYDGDIGLLGGTVGPCVNHENEFWSWLSSQGPYSLYESGFHLISTSQYTLSTSGTFDDSQRWAVVVPAQDCESAHVATQEFKSKTGSGYYDGWHGAPLYKEVHIKALVGYPNPGWYNELRTWTGPTEIMCDMNSFGIGPDAEGVGYNDASQTENNIYAFSGELSGQQGTPSGTYYSLFNVDINDPYYNGTITFSESDKGRYIGTEGYNSGGVLNNFFMGWI